MKLQQICISIENSPVRLYEVTRAFGEAGINMRALNLVDTGAFGQLRVIVSDVGTARRILMEKQLPALVVEVVATEVIDRPGGLAELLACLTGSGVTVLYTYAIIGFSTGKAAMIFRFTDNDRAIRILQENGFRLLGPADFEIGR
jgi:hypothetical protein